jgi:5-methylcytosine-specific restriction endonuclease McrA
MTEYKACSRCKQVLPYGAFNKDNSAISGLQSRCRECEREVRRDYYLRNKDKEVARVSNWHKTTEKGKANRLKHGNRSGKPRKAAKPKVYIPVAEQDEKTRIRLQAKGAKSRMKRRASFRNAEKNKITNNDLKQLLRQSCIYCGSPDRISIDHIIPLARGGRHSIGNLAPACFDCNTRKSARFVTEWRLNKPRADSLRRADPRSF